MMNTADRIKELMRERNITAKELVELCQPFCRLYNEKLSKSHISRYLSGNVTPKLKKLSILALALGTNEGYLAGLISSKEPRSIDNSEIEEVIKKLRKLDLFDLGKVSATVDLLLEGDKYLNIDKKTA